MSRNQKITPEEVYRQVHQANATVINTIELYHAEILKLIDENVMLRTDIDSLQKRIDELQPNLKKVPNKPEPPK